MNSFTAARAAHRAAARRALSTQSCRQAPVSLASTNSSSTTTTTTSSVTPPVFTPRTPPTAPPSSARSRIPISARPYATTHAIPVANPHVDAIMSTTNQAAGTVPPALVELFRRIEARLEHTTLGPGHRWHIVALACIVAGPDPEAVAHLYRYLTTTSPEYATPDQRQALVRRLREALVKSVSIVGVCKPLEAVLAISAIERPEDKDYTTTREGWQADDANLARANAWFGKIYQGNGTGTMDLFAAHRDFAWLSKHITYGLYLGDRQVLDDLDTEMVVFPAIMSQNLKTETWWHIRGTRRIGVSKDDTETLWHVIKDINAHFGVNLDKVPTVDEVEHDV